MGEEISKEIAVDGVDVRELYGAQNVYLEQIRASTPGSSTAPGIPTSTRSKRSTPNSGS